MVWQTAEWLCADNIVDSFVNQFHHFTGQEPSLASLISKGYNRFSIFCQLPDICRSREMPALCKLFPGSTADKFQELDT